MRFHQKGRFVVPASWCGSRSPASRRGTPRQQLEWDADDEAEVVSITDSEDDDEGERIDSRDMLGLQEPARESYLM